MHVILSTYPRLKGDSRHEGSLWAKRLQDERGRNSRKDGRDHQAHANLVVHLFWDDDLRCVYWKTVHIPFFLSFDGLYSEHHHNYPSYNRDSRRSASCSIQESIRGTTQRTLTSLHPCLWKIPRERRIKRTSKSSSIPEQRWLSEYGRKDRSWHD